MPGRGVEPGMGAGVWGALAAGALAAVVARDAGLEAEALGINNKQLPATWAAENAVGTGQG